MGFDPIHMGIGWIEIGLKTCLWWLRRAFPCHRIRLNQMMIPINFRIWNLRTSPTSGGNLEFYCSRLGPGKPAKVLGEFRFGRRLVGHGLAVIFQLHWSHRDVGDQCRVYTEHSWIDDTCCRESRSRVSLDVSGVSLSGSSWNLLDDGFPKKKTLILC